MQDPYTFFSCGQDGTCKFIDIRKNTKCDKLFCNDHTLVKHTDGITAIAINPLIPYHIVCAGLDGIVRFYDRRMLSVGESDLSEQISTYNYAHRSEKALFACFDIKNQEESNYQSYFHSLSTIPNNKRVTSVQYDQGGNELIASFQSDNIYLLDWRV